MNSKIKHSGVIETIEGGHARVRIVQTSACSACKVAGHCNASESKVKLIDVYNLHGKQLSIGQEVVVWASHNAANKALLLGFGVPFLLLVAALVIGIALTGDEAFAGLVALGALVPYYLLLYLARHQIGKSISFHIE